MDDINMAVEAARSDLKQKFDKLDDKRSILRDKTLRNLYSQIRDIDDSQRAEFGQAINDLKSEVQAWVHTWEDQALASEKTAIDITAPFDENTPDGQKPKILGPDAGSAHPVLEELANIADIFKRMGFSIEEARQLDDEYHMFDSLNFPADHPARDEYDTFHTEDGLVLPAHTSNMQHRILKSYKLPIYAVIPGRVFRNEDLDAYHEHTFHQVEGIVVDEVITLGDMLGTIREFLSAYFEEKIEYKTQPFYFPFVEPGLEFLIKTPKGIRGSVNTDWLEIMGCGMIHPNVLKEAGVDPKKYSGFAWGMGVERLVMLKYGIEDVRHFMSGNLDFLKQFGANK